MESVRIDGMGGWIEYDGERLSIVRSGIWNTLTGMAGTNELALSQITSIRFRKAVRGHGGGFIQFLRADDPLAKMQKKMLGVYGRKDDIAAASLDPYALTFNFRQQVQFAEFKERIEQDAGLASSPIEEPTEAIQMPVETVVDYTAKKPRRSGWVRPDQQASQNSVANEPAEESSDSLARPAHVAQPAPARQPSPAANDVKGSFVRASGVEQSSSAVSLDEPGVDPIDAIRRLAELRDVGIISASDFESKKAELLSRL